jgi:hypothetical protein
MSDRVESRVSNDAVSAAEVTLRLLARLPAPVGLEERVHAGLRAAPRRTRVLAWPASRSGEWMRAAAAAAIVCVVAGGGWGIYMRVQPGQIGPGIGGPRLAAPGGFTEGGAVRRPQTLVGPTVSVPVGAQTTTKTKAPVKPAVTAAGAKSAAGNKTGAVPAAQ